MQFSQPPPLISSFTSNAPPAYCDSTLYAPPTLPPQLPGYFSASTPVVAGVAGSGPPQSKVVQPGVVQPQVVQPGFFPQQVALPSSRFLVSNNEKSFVEYKNYVFYFNSHLENSKPIVLNKGVARKLINHFKILDPFVIQQKRKIEQDLTLNAELLFNGKDPIPPRDVKFYQVSLSTFKHFDIRLEANVYNNNIYIWLRLYVQDKDDPTIYRPCKGGILFGEDQYLNFENFFNICK